MKRIATALMGLLLFLGAVVVCLPSTGLLEGLIWRMERTPAGPTGKTLAEELGFAADARLLVVNSDDSCAHRAFTLGLEEVAPHGLVRSTSVIVHDRNDDELNRIAELADDHPDLSIGVHLMLTNEYQDRYPWAPVLSPAEVPTLYNPSGRAWETITEVEDHVDPREAEREFIAQIERALAAGIDVSHLDSHMGTVYRPSRFPGADEDGLTQAAIRSAERFDLPLTLSTFDQRLEPSMRVMDAEKLIRPDTFFGFYELEEMNSHLGYEGPAIQKGITAWVVHSLFELELPYVNQVDVSSDVPIRMAIYQKTLKNLAKPGLNHFFMHAAMEEPGGPIPSGLNHAEGVDRIVRLGDTAVWSSPQMTAFLHKQGFELVNYRQVRDVQRRWRVVSQ